MKKIISMSVIVIVLLSLFVSCGRSDDQNKTSQPAILSADSILDQQIYQSALYAKDASKCADISDAETVEECKNVIESLLLMEKASLTLDKSLCNKIKLKRYKETCLANVQEGLSAKEEQEKNEQKEIENVEISQEATDKGDHTICDEIEDDESMRNTCKLNILVNRAINEKNPSLCELIGVAQYTKECTNTAQELISITD